MHQRVRAARPAALHFLQIGLLDRLAHPHYGLAIVLGLIGVKLALHYLHTVSPSVPEIRPGSLVAVVLAFTGMTATSLRATRGAEPVRTEAG